MTVEQNVVMMTIDTGHAQIEGIMQGLANNAPGFGKPPVSSPLSLHGLPFGLYLFL